jgi:hypothetical protein
MVLRNGFPVRAYVLLRTSAQQHRPLPLIASPLLQGRYPGLLPPTAVQHTFTALPHDVWEVTEDHLSALARQLPHQWLVVGGWECQDLSPAGPCTGLHGHKSSTFAPLVHILAALQRSQQQLPPAFLVENTAMQHNFRNEWIRTTQYGIICEALGEPVCVDAAQFDSLAHRVRNYWTNLCTTGQLQAAVDQVRRTPGLDVTAAIDPSSAREPVAVQRDDADKGSLPRQPRGSTTAGLAHICGVSWVSGLQGRASRHGHRWQDGERGGAQRG